MARYDLRLAGGRVVLDREEPVEADVLVRGGRIAAIVEPGATAAAAELMDLRGLVVMPGAIDPHLHLGHGHDISRPREPADADRETAAAAAGGITTFLPYVMSPEPYERIRDELLAIMGEGARIDYGFHFIVCTDAQLRALPRYIAEFGVPTAKLFMNLRGNEGDRLGLPPIDDGFLYRLLVALKAHGGMLCPHPENIEIAWALRDEVMDRDPDGTGGLASWNAMRPPLIEAEALNRVCFLGRKLGVPVYAVHTSSADALEAALDQRRLGGRVFVETCTQYLTLGTDSPIGTLGKVNPPLRPPADREAIWRGIIDGHIDTVATDHVHRPRSAKDGGIWKAQPGFPGMETYMPLLLSEGYHGRGLSLRRIADLTSGNAARIMGLAPRKGAIALGADADFCIVDLEGRTAVDPDRVLTAAGYSVHAGWTFRGRVVHTLVRGRAVFRDGAPVPGTAGHGSFVPRRLGGRPA